MAEQKDVIYFIAQVGHEIRTPLNAIKGFGQLLDDETFGSLNEQQHKYLDKMLESSDRLLEIVEQLLDWAKLESGQAILQYESVDLYYLIMEICDLLAIKVSEKNIVLSASVQRQTIIAADSARLREVLLNLLTNAIKFTDNGGVITITVNQGEHQTLISIEDNGCGISLSQQEKLFQPFSRGEKNRSGEKSNGLGLWICRSIVALHQGRIWVKSEENIGSTFYVLLPNQPKK